jgi:hypothetical protein
MKLNFKPSLDPDLFEATADVEFVVAFNAAVNAIAGAPLPEGLTPVPPPEFAKGARRLKISASRDSPLRVSRELVEDPGGALEVYLCDSAARNVGRVLQSHGMTGLVSEVRVFRRELAEIVEMKLIATLEFPQSV